MEVSLGTSTQHNSLRNSQDGRDDDPGACHNVDGHGQKLQRVGRSERGEDDRREEEGEMEKIEGRKEAKKLVSSSIKDCSQLHMCLPGPGGECRYRRS